MCCAVARGLEIVKWEVDSDFIKCWKKPHNYEAARSEVPKVLA